MKIPLDSPIEKALHFPPIATLTWYKGDVSNAKAHLESRCRMVLDQNPWLGGQIQRETGCFVLVHDDCAADLDVDILKLPSLDRATPLGQLYSKIRRLITVNKQRLWQITLIDAALDSFALLFAVSHDIADAHVYYRLLSMLHDGEIVRMQVGRAYTEDEARELLHSDDIEQLDWPAIGGFVLCSGLRRAVVKPVRCLTNLPRRLLSLYHPSTDITVSFLVDNEQMTKHKASAAKEGQMDYCSTNDVITSWFFSALNVVAGLVWVDCRDSFDWAGPQTGRQCTVSIPLLPPDYAHPSLIRKAVTTLRRPVSRSVPGFWSMIRTGAPMAAVSNWTKFGQAGDAIPGCARELALPLIDPLPYQFVDMVVMVIFAPRPAETAVLVSGDAMTLARLQAPAFLRASSFTNV